MTRLDKLTAGMKVIYGGDKVATVGQELADAFKDGDRLIVVQDTGDLLHVPGPDWATANAAVTSASSAFAELQSVPDHDVSAFYELFAARLEDEGVFGDIRVANEADVARSKAGGWSTTRLILSDRMRADMIEGLRMWASAGGGRNTVESTVTHEGWELELVRSGLGVVGFVFEGRPNVIADATGVLRSGNAAVFRIGSAALATARAVMEGALIPALLEAGLPGGAVTLVDSPSRAAGWAMFANPALSLAVARGSGTAVSQLGAVARQSGTPVSLHGTGGSWIAVGATAEAKALSAAVLNSLDRKVCNTANTICVVESRAPDLIPVILEALDDAGRRRGATSKLHYTARAESHVPDDWHSVVTISRADGESSEPKAELIGVDGLGREWEWEESPEVTLTVVESVDEAIDLFNELSPKFGASLISSDADEQDRFFDQIDAPFVGNGFTRWVDGQYALNRPELGLSNWQHGRLFGRGAILSGDSVYTIRGRARQSDPNVHR